MRIYEIWFASQTDAAEFDDLPVDVVDGNRVVTQDVGGHSVPSVLTYLRDEGIVTDFELADHWPEPW